MANKKLNDLYNKIVELHGKLKDPDLSYKEKSVIRKDFLESARKLKQMVNKN